MKIILNGNLKEIEESVTLKNIIEQFSKDSSRIIAELNGAVVKHHQWADRKLEDGDSLELVNFVGGG